MIETPSMATDAELLRQYIRGSSQAFGELARRYLPLIYSSALRQTRDAHLAEDVAQAALILLSRKAGHIDPATLPGWLVRTTHFAARTALRQARRRAIHEQRAAAMSDTAQTRSSDTEEISHQIDWALSRLRAKDRTMVVLRYFQERSFADIAGQFHITEAAAQRRVARAVQKLRGILASRGASITAAALPAALGALALHSAPSALIESAGSVTSLRTTSASYIAKGTAMGMAKTKAAVAVVAGVLVAGVAAPVIYRAASSRAENLATTTPSTQGSSPMTGELPSGMSVQVLGVKHLPDGPWLTPGGEPIKSFPPPSQKVVSKFNWNFPGAKIVLLMRMDVPKDVSWSTSIPGAWGAKGQEEGAEHYEFYLISPPPGDRTITVGVDAATGPWDTVHIPASASSASHLSVEGTKIKFDPPAEVDGKTELTQHGFAPNASWSAYGVDVNGQTINYGSMNSRSEDDSSRTTYTFDKPLSQFKEFIFQMRPYNYHATIARIPVAQPTTSPNSAQ